MANSDVPVPRGPRNTPSSVKRPPLSTGSSRDWVVRWWKGGGGGSGAILRLLSLPLEWAFRMGSGFRNRLYDRGILPLQRAPVPVVSVGNLTVGGSGKTPFSAWLVRGLRARGETPALVARGYGQDEIALHRRWNPDSLILAMQDRAYGAWKAARKGASVVVLDDGFQHRRLGRELDIVLVSATTPERVRILPRGPFREPLAAVRRAGVVIVTRKGRADDPSRIIERLRPQLREAPVVVSFLPDCWTDLAGNLLDAPAGEYLGVCGIGDPEGFSRTLLDATGRSGEVLAYPDHHEYSWSDVLGIQALLGGRTLVTTEKDAVKLEPYRENLPDLRILHLRVEVADGEERFWRHVDGVLRSARGSR